MTADEARRVVRFLGWRGRGICVRVTRNGRWSYTSYVMASGRRFEVFTGGSLCEAVRAHDSLVRRMELDPDNLLCPDL